MAVFISPNYNEATVLSQVIFYSKIKKYLNFGLTYLCYQCIYDTRHNEVNIMYDTMIMTWPAIGIVIADCR